MAIRASLAKALHAKSAPVSAGFRLPTSICPRRPSTFTASLTTTSARALPSQQGISSEDKPIDTSLEGLYEAVSDTHVPKQDRASDSSAEPRSADAPSQEVPDALGAATGERRGSDASSSSSGDSEQAVKKVQKEQLQEENENVMPANPS